MSGDAIDTAAPKRGFPIAAHLAFLEDFVRARLREHARGAHGWRNQALANRLPGWMQNGKNREEILKGVERLREKQ